jgi:nicotinate phosphoribosyltransferase
MKGLQREDDETIIQKTIEKEKKFKTLQVPFAEFGTRRRHSYRVHRLVMQALTRWKTLPLQDLPMYIWPCYTM